MTMKKGLLKPLLTILITGTILLACSGSDTRKDQNQESIVKENNNVEKKPTSKEKEELEDDQLRGVLKREIESLNTSFIDTLDKNSNFIDPQYDLELKTLSLRFVVFVARASVIQKTEQRTDVENKKLASVLRLKSAERQKKEYPALRSRYGKIMAATMWEHDVTIKVWGDENSFISMTNSAFAEKSTIKDVYMSIKDALIMYRFKKVIFRTHKSGEEIGIDLETPIDSELVSVNEIQVN
jgi:hypothetical protein